MSNTHEHDDEEHEHVHGEDCAHGPKPITVDKVGRNDPCPCKSGKKYKKCCGGQK